MNIKYTFLAVLALGIAIAGWFFASPLFIDKVVDEPFIDFSITKEQVAEMTPAEREKTMSDMMAVSATQSRQVDDPMERAMAETPMIVSVGRFRDADVIHKGSGRASLYRIPDGSHVIRLEDFEVTNGPALVVLLAGAIDPKNAQDVKNFYVKIGDLKGNIGNQNYVIPQSINVGMYRSVVIWCELFDVMFATATLNVT